MRQLAREAQNKWDRGTYVRMTTILAWIALETSCQDALGVTDIGYRFKENLDRALKDAGIRSIDWSKGLWQKVGRLHSRRKAFVHRFSALQDMFPEVALADDAIDAVRSAIRDIHARAEKTEPVWLSLDETLGWNTASQFGHATITALHHGAKAEDPRSVKIFMVVGREERLTAVLPPGSDPSERISQLINGVRIPINGIRVYEDDELIKDLIVNMRGNA
jgi:hypothetical protein